MFETRRELSQLKDSNKVVFLTASRFYIDWSEVK
jgi:hypothetical protein